MSIEVGDICVFDKENNLNLSGESMNFVKITRKKRSIFGNKYYGVFCSKDGTTLSSSEMPIPVKKLSLYEKGQVVIIRYPSEVPIVKKEEVEILKSVYNNYLERGNDRILRIEKLILKLELFTTIIHEY